MSAARAHCEGNANGTGRVQSKPAAGRGTRAAQAGCRNKSDEPARRQPGAAARGTGVREGSCALPVPRAAVLAAGMTPERNGAGKRAGHAPYIDEKVFDKVGFDQATRYSVHNEWQPIALPAVDGRQRAPPSDGSPGESPDQIRLSYQNTDGWRTSRVKRVTLGQQFSGRQSVTARAGYDVAAYAEVHCNGLEDPQRYADDVNPEGRTYFTWWLAVCVGPRLNGVPVQATAYGGGRVIRLDVTLNGKARTYLFVYAPVERDVRPGWLARFPACMPAARDVVMMGDFNLRMSRLDHAGGAAPSAGHVEWAHLRETYKTHDVWRRRHPAEKRWSFHGPSGHTRIDWVEASEAVADELTSVSYLMPAACCGDHSVVAVTQRLKASSEQPVLRMSPEIAETGTFMADVRALVQLATPAFLAAADKSDQWDALMEDIMALYVDHVANLKAKRHSLLRRLQRKADRTAAVAVNFEHDEAKRSHAELSLEVERDAMTRDAEQQMQREDWGDQPTRRFFQQAKTNHASTTIRKLYRYEPSETPGEVGRIDTSVVDADPTRIAASLSAYWQDIFRNTTGTHTPYARIADDYPDDMCVPLGAQHGLGADITPAEVATAIRGLSTRRSTAGVVAEVFKAASDGLAPLLAAQLNYANTCGRLSKGQRYGRITLLFKKGDPLSPDMYRPVAVLRADYKACALVLTARINPHLARVTSPTQTGFVKGRFIHENCLRLRDAMAYAATDQAARLNPTATPTLMAAEAAVSAGTSASGADVAVLSTDLRKAYDSCQLEVLFTVATRVGGPGYGRWLRTLYTGLERSILVGAGSEGTTVLSPRFRLCSGVPQGCCHACVAFILYMEGLAHRLRADPEIRGLRMPDGSTMLDVRYADDCAYTVLAPSLHRLLAAIEVWTHETGMSLHEVKTTAGYWGRRRADPVVWHPRHYGTGGDVGGAGAVGATPAPGQRLSWLPVGGALDILGMPIGYGVTDDDVWGAVARKMHVKLMMWGRVRLSFSGRVTVIRSMAYSQIWYLGTVYDMSAQKAAQLRAIARHFFWRGTMPKGVTPGAPAAQYAVRSYVSDADLAATSADGGFGLWDPVHQLRALRAQWVRRLLAPEPATAVPWRVLPVAWMAADLGTSVAADVILLADKPLRRSPLCLAARGRQLPGWWRAPLADFAEIVGSQGGSPPPATAEECLAQPLWHNRWLAGPNGAPLVADWSGCVSGKWQPWAVAGIDRVADLYEHSSNGWTLCTLDRLQRLAACRAADAGIPGMAVGQVVAVRPPDDPDGGAPTLPWLARVDAVATQAGCRVTWMEADTRAGAYVLGSPGRVSPDALLEVLRSTVAATGLRMTAQESATLRRIVQVDATLREVQWRYPSGQLQMEQLLELHAALRRARWDRRLAGAPVRLGAGQWCVGAVGPDRHTVMSVLSTEHSGGVQRCTVLRWQKAASGYTATQQVTAVAADRLRRVTMLDVRDGDVTGSANVHAPSLRLMRDGVLRVRMVRRLAEYTVASGREWQRGDAGLIWPLAATATAVGLGHDDVRAAMRRVDVGRWQPQVQQYWWRQATAAYPRQLGLTVQLCDCCQVRQRTAARTRTHTAADCPDWEPVWRWAVEVLARAGAALPAHVTRGQWMLFGHGTAVTGPKARVQAVIWGSVLGAVHGLTTGLRVDGVEFLPVAAISVARAGVVRAAAADLQRVGRSVKAELTRAAWAARWSGLVRLAPKEAAGYVAADGW